MFAKSLLALGALAALVSPEPALACPLAGRYEVPTPAPIPRDDTSTCKVVTVTVDDSAATSTVRLLFSVSSIWPETVQDNMPQSTITGERNKAQNRACFEADVLKLRGNCW
ncbi:predicted protein [Postia placenta Mad-698-R]|nr:predicted protein [Postia placenta Mad-698-R]